MRSESTKSTWKPSRPWEVRPDQDLRDFSWSQEILFSFQIYRLDHLRHNKVIHRRGWDRRLTARSPRSPPLFEMYRPSSHNSNSKGQSRRSLKASSGLTINSTGLSKRPSRGGSPSNSFEVSPEVSKRFSDHTTPLPQLRLTRARSMRTAITWAACRSFSSLNSSLSSSLTGSRASLSNSIPQRTWTKTCTLTSASSLQCRPTSKGTCPRGLRPRRRACAAYLVRKFPREILTAHQRLLAEPTDFWVWVARKSAHIAKRN